MATCAIVAMPSAQGASNISYGITVGAALPPGATSVRVGRDTYYVFHGSFYRQLKAGVVLVPAPIGATIKELPRGAAKFTIGKATYYRHAGVYFATAGRSFKVCEKPAGAPDLDSDAAADQVAQTKVELGDTVYVFRRGRFFQQSPDGLLGKSTPVGGIAQDFPPDALSVWFRDREYFEANGVFFQETPKGYQVIAPPWQSTSVVTQDAIAQASPN